MAPLARPVRWSELETIEDAIVLVEGKTLKEDGVHHREDSGVGADAESECSDGNGGKTPILEQGAGAVTDILQQGVEHSFPPDVCHTKRVDRKFRTSLGA